MIGLANEMATEAVRIDHSVVRIVVGDEYVPNVISIHTRNEDLAFVIINK